MKPFIFFFLAIFFVTIPVATCAQSQQPLDRNLIFAQGTAEVTGQNDSVSVFLSVQSEAKKMEKAAADNATKTKAVLQAIKDLHVPSLKMKTSNYRVTPQKNFKARPPIVKGYEVHNDIEITMEGFAPKELSDQISVVIDASLKNGANTVRNILFYIQDKKGLEKQGLTLATMEAMDQAQVLASAAGVTLGRIVSISTEPIAVPLRKKMFRAATVASDDASMKPPIESGESKIHVRVSVVYEME